MGVSCTAISVPFFRISGHVIAGPALKAYAASCLEKSSGLLVPDRIAEQVNPIDARGVLVATN